MGLLENDFIKFRKLPSPIFWPDRLAGMRLTLNVDTYDWGKYGNW